MITAKLCSKRRFNTFFKCCCATFLVIFYFLFLFRESLNYRQINNIKLKHQQRLHINEYRHKIHLKKAKAFHKTNGKSSELDDYSIKSDYYSSTLNPIYEYSEELHVATENDLMIRKSHMWNVCVKENITNVYPPNAWEFFLSQGHNLVWCNVFKAASSTWMYYFNILGGYNIKYLQRTKTSPLELARKKFPRPKLSELQEALQNSVSFLTVREPFERLLSAYRDKLENCHNKYYKVLANQIVQAFRKKNNTASNNIKNTYKKLQQQQQQQQPQKNPTTIKSKSLLLYKQKMQKQSKLHRSYFHPHSHPNQHHHDTGPTFKEFLLFLIQNYKNGKQFDEHWAPIYSFCTPCSINYTIIVKVETFQRDSEYIIRQAGLEPLLLGKFIKKISNQSKYKSGNLIKRYFSQIDRDILNELIKIYRLDFELFEYDYTKYYNIVQSSAPTSLSLNEIENKNNNNFNQQNLSSTTDKTIITITSTTVNTSVAIVK